MTTQTILRIDSSAMDTQSTTKALGNTLEQRLLSANPKRQVVQRVLTDLPFLDQDWVEANLTDPNARSQSQQQTLALSDELVAELALADEVIMTIPMYNFSMPSALKTWIDLICRARLSFSYGENGPVGLLDDKPVYVIIATGGVPLGSPMDFLSGYITHIFNFIGIQDVRIISAEKTNQDRQLSEDNALSMINHWVNQETTAAV